MIILKQKYRHCAFTFIEMILVVSIIGILAGILMPSFARLRDKAKFVRWQGFQTGVNLDPDIMINFNFEFEDFSVYHQGIAMPALYNSANGNKRVDYSQYNYHGLINGSPEWGRGGGRWEFKNCLMFDGNNDYVTLPNSQLLNLNPGNEDFTFTCWIRLYGGGIQYLFSKAKNSVKSQYNLHLNGGENLFAGVGNTQTHWKSNIIYGKWVHLAMVNEVGKLVRTYVNGKEVTDIVGKTDIPEEAIYDANFVLGAMGGEGGIPRQYFSGDMDEFMVFNRALQPSEIRYHYEMGNPY